MADAPSDNSLFLQIPSVISRTVPVDLLAQKSTGGNSLARTGGIPIINEKTNVPIARFNGFALIGSEHTWLLERSWLADRVYM